jgi:hypothetical protein
MNDVEMKTNSNEEELSAFDRQHALWLSLAAGISLGLISGGSAQQSSQPIAAPGAAPGNNAGHAAEVGSRGDVGMGFSHARTSHHFFLLSDGGTIQVEADDPTDQASRDAIRQHMNKIATMFSNGDFNLPMFIHDAVPPGVETMKQLKSQITYLPENTVRGGQVCIFTTNPITLKAVHDFLRFQIKDHRTGDPTTIREPGAGGSPSPTPRRPRPGDNLGHDAQPARDSD